jgi:hypothetical protein
MSGGLAFVAGDARDDRGENERLLADIIIGLPAEGHTSTLCPPAWSEAHLREPRWRTPAVDGVRRLDRPRPAQVKSEDIDGVYVRRYSLDERTGHVGNRETTLIRVDRRGWSVDSVGPGETVDTASVKQLVASLVDLVDRERAAEAKRVNAMLDASAGQGQIRPRIDDWHEGFLCHDGW